jgi:hypothetical protein
MGDEDNPVTYAKLPEKQDDAERSDEPAPFTKQQYTQDVAAARPAVETEYPPSYYPNYTAAPPPYPTYEYGSSGAQAAVLMDGSPDVERALYPAAYQNTEGRRLVMVLPVDEDPSCVTCGLMFSWIPLIGWLTFCMNYNARPGSRRKVFALYACWIATTVFVINAVILFALRA